MKKLIGVLLLLFIHLGLFAQTPDIKIRGTAVDAVCPSDGWINVFIEGADTANLNKETADFRAIPLGEGNGSDWARNNPVPNLRPGLYLVEMRAFYYNSSSDSIQISRSSTQVRVNGNYKQVLPSVVNVQKSFNCVSSGAATMRFLQGVAPYTAKITSHPVAYTGATEFVYNTEGDYVISDLPVGTYVFDLSDRCGEGTKDITIEIKNLQKDFPDKFTATANSKSKEDCKTFNMYIYPRTTANANYYENHELYEYMRDISKYYDIVLTENANLTESTAVSSSAGVSGSSPDRYINYQYANQISLMNLNFDDLFPVTGTFPAGGSKAYIRYKIKGTNCYSDPVELSMARPSEYRYHAKNFACDSVDIFGWQNSSHFVCYPIKAEIIDQYGTVVKTTNIQNYSETLIGRVLYGTYKIRYTSVNGAQWETSSYKLESHNSTRYYAEILEQSYCPEDGKRAYLRIRNRPTSYPYAYFIPGTKIKFVEVPTGQTIPYSDSTIVIPTNSNYNICYVFSANPFNAEYVKLEQGLYKFKVINPCGDTTDINITYNPSNPSYYSSWDNGYCMPNFGKNYSYLYSSSSYIPGGSIITYTGCTGAKCSDAAVLHTNVTIPPNYTRNFNPFVLDYRNSNEFSFPAVAPGNYNFTIFDFACNTTINYSLTVPEVFSDIEDFYIDTVYTCNGVGIVPHGTMKYAGVPRPASNVYFRVYSAKNEDGTTMNTKYYDTRTVRAGDTLLLEKNGYFTIQISPGSGSSCASDTIGFKYEMPRPTLDYMYSSAYVCNGGTQGFINLKALSGFGNGPYEYHLIGTTHADSINTTGYFEYGAPREMVKIRITDRSPEATALGCFPYLTTELQMLDLSEASIAYSTNDGNFCEGETINLNCVSLGNTAYKWTYPNGTVIHNQYPRIPNAVLADSGWYVVEVKPENCGETLRDSVLIKVHKNPDPVLLTNDSVNLCYQSGSYTYSQVTGAVADPYRTLRWYRNGTILTTETFSTNSYGVSGEYYVSQVNDSTGCEGPLTRFVINIVVPPSAPIVAFPDPVCYGDTVTLYVLNTDIKYKYVMVEYTNSTVGDTLRGNGDTLVFKFAPLNSTSKYIYFRAIDTITGCMSSFSSARATMSTWGTQADIEAQTYDTICSGEQASLKAELSSSSTITNPIFRWYASSSSMVVLHVGPTLDTTLTNTGNSWNTQCFWVSVEGDGICESYPSSSYRRQICALVKPNVNAASRVSVSYTSSICSGDSTIITASISSSYASNPVYYWYTSQTETIPFHTGNVAAGGNIYQTPPLDTTISYYIGVSGDYQCETLPGNRRQVTITVAERPIAIADSICPDTKPVIIIPNAYRNVYYEVYTVQTGGSYIARAVRTTTPAVDTLKITLSSTYNQTTTFYVKRVDSPCTYSWRTPVTVEFKDAPKLYPDMRFQVCPEPGVMVNLNSYLDMREFVSVNWANSRGITITNGKINAGDLTATDAYAFTATISNTCYSNVKAKLYVKALTSGVSYYPPDTVKICKDYAENIILNQILGIAAIAGGTWDFTSLNPTPADYLKITDGSVSFNGLKAYNDSKGTPYPFVAGARQIVFEYSILPNACNSPTVYKVVIVLTD